MNITYSYHMIKLHIEKKNWIMNMWRYIYARFWNSLVLLRRTTIKFITEQLTKNRARADSCVEVWAERNTFITTAKFLVKSKWHIWWVGHPDLPPWRSNPLCKWILLSLKGISPFPIISVNGCSTYQAGINTAFISTIFTLKLKRLLRPWDVYRKMFRSVLNPCTKTIS